MPRRELSLRPYRASAGAVRIGASWPVSPIKRRLAGSERGRSKSKQGKQSESDNSRGGEDRVDCKVVVGLAAGGGQERPGG